MQSLTEKYDGWIKKITRRMFNKFGGYYQYNDLLSVAYLASVEAERTYDETRAKFSAYIKPRIEGAIIRSVSNITNSQDTMLQSVYKFIDDYYEKHKKLPAQHVILGEVGVSEKQFMKALDATNKITEVDFDSLEEHESNDVDLDTLAEYSSIMDVVSQLPANKRDRITDFLNDPKMNESKIQDIVKELRGTLNIGV